MANKAQSDETQEDEFPVSNPASATSARGSRSSNATLVPHKDAADFPRDPEQQQKLGTSIDDDVRLPVLIQLNDAYTEGLTGAAARFIELYRAVVVPERPDPQRVTDIYYRCQISAFEMRSLREHDADQGRPERAAIIRIWPDMPVKPMML